MEHKAYIFYFEEFSKELRPILGASLKSGNIDQLRAFIISNKSTLSDPYKGEPLEEDWENMIDDWDVHQYGDFALTKYYSPAMDEGLGCGWENVQDILSSLIELKVSPLLGEPLGDSGEYFDPGKMGSYFQDNGQVKNSLSVLGEFEDALSESLNDDFDIFRQLLESAANENKGVYVTF
jgi:hypothetical protein